VLGSAAIDLQSLRVQMKDRVGTQPPAPRWGIGCVSPPAFHGLTLTGKEICLSLPVSVRPYRTARRAIWRDPRGRLGAPLAERLKEAATQIALRSDRAKLEAERQRVEAVRGPIVYMAAMIGLPVE
jgi:hypothetical protein